MPADDNFIKDSDSEQDPYPSTLNDIPGNPAMENPKIFSIGAMAISHILVDWPPRNQLPDGDLVEAGRWLWRFHIAASTAKTKKRFIELMAFLLYP